MYSLYRRVRLGGSPFRVERLVQYLELLHCFVLLPRFRELLGQHQSNVVLAGTEIGEFLQRLEGIGVAPRLVHPVGVLEEVLFRVAVESLLRADLPELVVDVVSRRRVPEDLVAESDGVVEVPALGVEVDGLLVVVHRLVGLVQPQVEVADAVVDRDITVLAVLGQRDDLNIDLEGPVELLFLLEFGSLFLELFDVGHYAAAGRI